MTKEPQTTIDYAKLKRGHEEHMRKLLERKKGLWTITFPAEENYLNLPPVSPCK